MFEKLFVNDMQLKSLSFLFAVLCFCTCIFIRYEFTELARYFDSKQTRQVLISKTSNLSLNHTYIKRKIEKHTARNDSRKREEEHLYLNNPILKEGELSIISECSQPASKKLKSCRQAMAYTLNMHSVSCPEKCITFGSFGRFNNFIKSLVAAIERNVFVNNETNRKSVHIDASLWQQFNLDNVWDSSALNKICVFRQQMRSLKCERVSVKTLFYATCLDKQKCLLIKAWLLFAAVQENIHNQVLKLIEGVGHDYSTLHSRFLEGSCHVRHKRIHLSTDYCDMKPEFVKKTLAAMGHFNQPIVLIQ